jgi:hypothetical protein
MSRATPSFRIECAHALPTSDVPLGLTNVCFEGNNGHDADLMRCRLTTHSRRAACLSSVALAA